MKPKISVIVPVYNVEKYIEECLNSIINQTLKDIEIIIVNDGSTDKSYKIIDRISRKDSRITVINQENSGVSKARNVGMMSAKGDYISFIDPDDYIKKDMLEKMYTLAEKNNCEVVQCNYNIYNNEEYSEIHQNIKPNKVLEKNEIENYLKCGLIDGSLTTYVWDKIYKTKFLKENKLKFNEDLSMFEDWYFIMDLVSRIKKFIFLPENLYYYRIVLNSLSRKYIYNYENLVLNLQTRKFEYMSDWGLCKNSYKLKYTISFYSDILKLINYILDKNYELPKTEQLLKLDTIIKSKLVRENFNRQNDKIYISNTHINYLYLKPILYGIRLENKKLIYLFNLVFNTI